MVKKFAKVSPFYSIFIFINPWRIGYRPKGYPGNYSNVTSQNKNIDGVLADNDSLYTAK